jgi:hypothetical protein
MAAKRLVCPECQSPHVSLVRRTYPELIPNLTADGESVPLPVFYLCQCDNGHRFEMDITTQRDKVVNIEPTA